MTQFISADSMRRLHALLDYDRDTGIFTWRVAQSNRIKVGQRAGFDAGQGYRAIRIEGRIYREHRVAWVYVHGSWPRAMVDHINGRRSDNRISNLREVDNSTNMENQRSARSDSAHGLMGVRLHHRGKLWEARIKVKGRSRILGRYRTKDEAAAAYLAAKRSLHAGCTI